MTMPYNQEPELLSFKDVSKYFWVKSGFLAEKKELCAVKEVSFKLFKGECLGLVGESGCGKSTLGRLACGLLAPSQGAITFKQKPLPKAGPDSSAKGQLQMIFQDPYSSLNPRMSVGASIAEPLLAKKVGQAEAQKLAEEMLAKIGLAGYGARYPHEFSGGQRQRIAVARALITR
ncbi:MAG: ATP-binding cassette domain-containing protein, partial [Desulfovibrio sp.]|nr:ATP-binding cassette domain-containing protein [Desulfovibrio sp.]